MQIAILPGDGIGPEVMTEAVKVLQAIAKKFNHNFNLKEGLIGGAAYDKFGLHLPKETIGLCEQSQAILFGSVGGPVSAENNPKWTGVEKNCLLGLRKHFDLFANLRPCYLYKPLQNLSALKEKNIQNGVDVMIVRELTGGIYFGEHTTKNTPRGKIAEDIMRYSEKEIERIIKVAFETAKKRRQKVTCVDKANVLDCSLLWREITKKVHAHHPDINLEFMYVDNAAMQLIKNPNQFDVIVTENMFGDILSDLASTFAGSIGLLPSASLNKDGFGLYEPIGGSAQDIAGQGIANPIAQILSAAMMLKYSFNLIKEAAVIEKAVVQTLGDGIRTADIMEEGCQKIGTAEMGQAICDYVDRL